MAVTITVNGKQHSIDAAPDTPLLYALRNDLELNGAKVLLDRNPRPTAAAISNAIANATGKRLRDLPFTRERVKAALA